MTRNTLRLALSLAAGSLALCAPQAQAGALEPVLQPAFFTYSGTQTFANNTGETTGASYALSTQAASNEQTIDGTTAGSTGTSLTADHEYSKADDAGSYTVAGSTTATGPAGADFDRSGLTYTATLSVADETQSLTVPLG